MRMSRSGLLRWLSAALVASLVVGCTGFASREDQMFFDADLSTRMRTMETYPLERQWELYLFGHQKLHPPDLALAGPIAKQGKAAADYILGRLSTTKNDLDHVSALWVFELMRRRGYFDVCGYHNYFNGMLANENRIQRKVTREYYRERLAELCSSAGT